MKKLLSKSEASKEIEEFFKSENLKKATAKEIKKIKRIAMKHNLQLKEKRKLFCKKCFNVYNKSKIRIKDKIKFIVCENCGYVSRWKVKNY